MRDLVDQERTLFREETIYKAVTGIAKRLDEEYCHTTPLLIGILDAAYIFMADLTRAMQITHAVGFLKAHSYRGNKKSSITEVMFYDPDETTADRDLVIVDTIADTGETLRAVTRHFRNAHEKPRSISTVSLLLRHGAELPPEKHLYGLNVFSDSFLVGYGLDSQGLYRNMRHIVALPPHVKTSP